MAIDTDAIVSKFQESVCAKVNLVQEGADRYRVLTPFLHEDGDHLAIVLRRESTGWVLSDEGHTRMRLADNANVSEKDFQWLGIEDRHGELILRVQDRFGDALFAFFQALLKIGCTDGRNAAWPKLKDKEVRKMQTYPGMNKKLVGLLRLSDDPKDLYIALRIEELESALSDLVRAAQDTVASAKNACGLHNPEYPGLAACQDYQRLGKVCPECPHEHVWGLQAVLARLSLGKSGALECRPEPDSSEPMMVAVYVDGGYVCNVASTQPEALVIVVDYDNEKVSGEAGASVGVWTNLEPVSEDLLLRVRQLK